MVKLSNDNKELVFLPLGGVGEIGMNLALYGYGPAEKREWMIVDTGISFPNEKQPGVDFIMPDISFVEENIANLKGIVITHAHEDHYGALRDLWQRLGCLDIPVWMTAFAEGVFRAKYVYGDKEKSEIPIKIYKEGDEFTVGPFSIEAIEVSHSIPEAMALAIKTPAQADFVIHTGDWRIGNNSEIGGKTNEKRLKEIGDKGVLAMICDSTNALQKGETLSEESLGLSFEKIMKESSGKVVIGVFSSNVSRVVSIARAAQNTGRQLLLIGRSLRRVADVAEELGYLKDLPEFITLDACQSVSPGKLAVVCTGSQGEESAILAKLSRQEIKRLSIGQGDTIVFSSRVIPGNEKSISRVKNRLIDMGVNILEENDALIHVSGHAWQNELCKMYKWVRPKIGIPVHGEAMHLSRHASLMSQNGIENVIQVRNGDMLRLFPGSPEIIDQVKWGCLYKDGFFVGNDEEMHVSERLKLASAGHITVIARVNFDSRNIDIQFVFAGVPHEHHIKGVLEGDNDECIIGVNSMEDCLLYALEDAIGSIAKKRQNDVMFIYNQIVQVTGVEAKKLWGKKPLVHAHLTLLSGSER